jgi:hypothetical protein
MHRRSEGSEEEREEKRDKFPHCALASSVWQVLVVPAYCTDFEYV